MMADDNEARLKDLEEADRRGLLPPEMKAAYEEAKKRGIVGKKEDAAPTDTPLSRIQSHEAAREAAGSDLSATLSTANERIAGALGFPVDLARAGLEFAGVPVVPAEKQFGGSESIRRAMRYLGMSTGEKPHTTLGQYGADILGSAGEAAVSGGAIGGTLKRIGAGFGGRFGGDVIKQVGETFAAPGPNIVSGAGAGAGGRASEDLGLPRPVGEILGAGAAGLAVPSTSLRTAPRVRDPVLDAYERLGLAPSAAEAGIGGMGVRWLQGNVLPQTFGGGNVMERFRTSRLTELTDIQERIAQGFGAPGTREEAGKMAQNKIMERWLNAKADNGAIIGDITEKYANEVVYPQHLIDALVKPVGGAGQPAVKKATLDPLVTEAMDIIRNTGGHLTVKDLRALRQKYGTAMEPGFQKNVNDAQVEQLWGAVTKDVEDLIKARSPDDLKRLKDANREYKVAMDDFQQNFKKLLGTEKIPVAPEKAYDIMTAAASDKARGDIDEFKHVWNALGPAERGKLSATVLTRMGAIDKNAPLSADNFQIGTFLREFRNLTPEAKNMLFNSTGNAKLAGELDDLVTVYDRIQEKVTRLASSSRSGTGMIFFGQAGLAGHAAMLMDPTLFLSSIGGPYVAAELLTRPQAVRAMIKSLDPIERAIDANLRAVPILEAIDAMRPQQGTAQ